MNEIPESSKERIRRVNIGFLGRLKNFLLGNITIIVTIAGFLLFGYQLWTNAHYQLPVIDEGIYLFKGLLYLSGRYQPFQDYGPLTYQMPLAFLIPGTIQFLFGPGLATGRYFACVISLLMIVGLWLTCKRLTNPWLAAGVVWVLALTPAIAKIYSMSLSEGLVACLLVWIMALTLGEKRRLWQLILASILTAVIFMIRIDLLPLFPLLCLYIFWQHGWKSALWSALACLLIIAIVHAIYWPNILRMWAYWLPLNIVPFLKSWRPPAGALPFWNLSATALDRLRSFTDAIRYFYIPIVGVVVVWILWPKKSAWKSDAHYRIAIFLSVFIFLMLAVHVWASLIQKTDTCIYCFAIYTTFYIPVALLLVALTIASWRTRLDTLRRVAAGITAYAILFFLAYGIMTVPFIERIMKMPVPRIRSMHILPGTAELWRLISNKLHLDLMLVADSFTVVIPLIVGGVLLVLLLLFARSLPNFVKRMPKDTSTLASGLIILLLVGALLNPTSWFGNGYHRYDSKTDILSADELAGKSLQKVIAPQAKIFWRGISPVTLLHLPNARIYPAQLDGDYSFKLGGDSDALERYGWWNESLGLQWINDAEYILVAPKYYNGWVKKAIESGGYQEISIFHATPGSQDSTYSEAIFPLVFIRK